jgi:hypothetical protein
MARAAPAQMPRMAAAIRASLVLRLRAVRRSDSVVGCEVMVSPVDRWAGEGPTGVHPQCWENRGEPVLMSRVVAWPVLGGVTGEGPLVLG